MDYLRIIKLIVLTFAKCATSLLCLEKKTKKLFLCGAPFVTVSKARSADGFYFYGNATKVLHSLSIFPICPVLFPTISPSFCRVSIKTNLRWLRKKTCVQNIRLCMHKYIE